MSRRVWRTVAAVLMLERARRPDERSDVRVDSRVSEADHLEGSPLALRWQGRYLYACPARSSSLRSQ